MIHEFKVGQLTCWAINESQRSLDLEGLQGIFSAIPEAELRQALETLSTDELRFCLTPLYIQSLGVLIDTGNGVNTPEERRTLNQLNQAGVSPSEVKTIFITHAHGDHINGLVNEAGELSYPQAKVVMGKAEWEFWTAPQPHLPADYLAHTQTILAKFADHIRLVEDQAEIVTDIKAVAAFGHTVGHMAVEIQSEGDTLFHVVDALHTLPQVKNPHWSPRFDADSTQSAETRRQIFERAARENLRLYTYHLPFPALGKINANDGVYQWQFERT